MVPVLIFICQRSRLSHSLSKYHKGLYWNKTACTPLSSWTLEMSEWRCSGVLQKGGKVSYCSLQLAYDIWRWANAVAAPDGRLAVLKGLMRLKFCHVLIIKITSRWSQDHFAVIANCKKRVVFDILCLVKVCKAKADSVNKIPKLLTGILISFCKRTKSATWYQCSEVIIL